METWIVFEKLSALYVAAHLLLVLPIRPHLFLLCSELLYVRLYFLGKQNLLQVDESTVFERQLFVFENLVEICSKLCSLKLIQAVCF